MINLKRNQLEILFPEVHPKAGIKIDFQRTLRVPDDGGTHYLPPGLGRFPLRHIEDYDLKKHSHLKKRGGVIMPMYQADALWLSLNPLYDQGYDEEYPVAVKIGTGKICAISGVNVLFTSENSAISIFLRIDMPFGALDLLSSITKFSLLIERE